jgi:hypothetical protein
VPLNNTTPQLSPYLNVTLVLPCAISSEPVQKKQDSCHRILDLVQEDSGLYKYEVVRKIVHLVLLNWALLLKSRVQSAWFRSGSGFSCVKDQPEMVSWKRNRMAREKKINCEWEGDYVKTLCCDERSDTGYAVSWMNGDKCCKSRKHTNFYNFTSLYIPLANIYGGLG